MNVITLNTTAPANQKPLVTKIKVGDFKGTLEFREEDVIANIGGREFVFSLEERMSDVQEYLLHELH